MDPSGELGRRARELLEPAGPLASVLGGFEEREGQIRMAEAVGDALESQRVLLCEAGTGTGKTLAYLVPAVMSGLRVVVSTATKALQEQIVDKDLPIVERVTRRDPRARLVKGLGNYLCLRRFDEVRKSAAAITDPALSRALPLLEAWAAETEVGDVAELAALADDDPVWREVSSSSDTRLGAACVHFDRCFVTRMRREAESARILVVNHHLFFADLVIKARAGRRGAVGGALPPYDAVIFDEAHRLEDVATDFFGTRLSRARLAGLLRDADRAFVSSGLADRLLSRGEGTALVAVVREAEGRLFEALAALGAARGDQTANRIVLGRDAWSGRLLEAYLGFDGALESLAGYAEVNRVSEAVSLVAERAQSARDDLAGVVDGARGRVAWMDVGATRRGVVAIGASPIDLGRVLRDSVFSPVGAVVVTSATLTTGGDSPMAFLRSRLGLDDTEERLDVPVDELVVDSPFDHAGRAVVYLPRDLPDVADPTFVARAADRIAELVGITGGGAFVLCTSVRAMNGIAAALGHELDRPPLVQGRAPKSALLSRFRADGHAVLVATLSFWEGVDVPGDALRLVVMDRIPFAVPTDPIVAARCEDLAERGADPFAAYTLPEAAITLKQGYGRLLRTKLDRGIVALLDRRAITRAYGRTLLSALPPARRTQSLDEVREFWATSSVGTLRERACPT